MNNAGTSADILKAAGTLDDGKGLNIAREALSTCEFSPTDFPGANPATVLGLQRMQRAGFFGARKPDAATALRPPALARLNSLPAPVSNMESLPEQGKSQSNPL